MRWSAAALALVAAAIHLALALIDLIPGEPTRGWIFGLMGAGYVGCAITIMLRRPMVDALIALYSVGLVLAYATSRNTLPLEPIGIATKVAETGLTLIAGTLFLRSSR